MRFHFSYEVDSPRYTGQIVEVYKAGQIIKTQIQVNALHKGGVHAFKVCKASFGQDPTQECLDANPVPFTHGKFVGDLKNGQRNSYRYRLK